MIRGICDYGDEHKNDDWQHYAAVTAAGFGIDIGLENFARRAGSVSYLSVPQYHLTYFASMSREALGAVPKQAVTDNYLKWYFFVTHLRLAKS